MVIEFIKENLLLFLIVIIILLILSMYNYLIKLRLRVKQSKSVIDVYLQQRFDLIPNLVNVVKGYINYEKEVLENLTKLRMEFNNTKNISVSEELNNQLNRIIIKAEDYPDLKANDQFLNLQKNLSKMESQLQAARRLYNNDVTKYNTKIRVIPFNLIAFVCGFKEEKLFEIDK